VRLGDFEIDLRAGEVRSGDRSVLLQQKSLRILQILLEHDGGLVTREEIQKRLWPNDTIVDFENGINTAVKRLRQALGDSADEPKYIETIPRRGYRLLVSAVPLVPEPSPSPEPSSSEGGLGASPATLTTNAASLIGKKVSHYRVLKVIGGGGMGLVYEAEDLKLGRRVALKFLPDELVWDAVALQRFEREAQTASSLNHPNICTIYEIEEHEYQPFIAMELLEGETLRDRLSALTASKKTVPLNELLEIAIQICTALQSAHEKGIIHRDIKPANIFLTVSGQVKILDFGLAKLVSSAEEKLADSLPAEADGSACAAQPARAASADPTLTRLGVALGTAGYMSPEQIRGETLDARTDIFSFGLVLYEMVTGQRAFRGETAAIVHAAIINTSPTPAPQLNPKVPPELEVIVNKALEKDRAQRYQSAAELRTKLQSLKNENLPSLTAPVAAQAKHRRSLRVALTIVAVLAIAGGATYSFLRPRIPVVTGFHQLTRSGRQKTEGSGAGRIADVETDGTRVYFQERDQGEWRIAQVSTTGGDVSYLNTPLLAYPWIYDISRNGSELLVADRDFRSGEQSFWLFQLPNGPSRRITGTFSWMQFLPGKDQVVYQRSSDPNRVFAANLDGSDAHSLMHLPGEVGEYFTLSPDGERVRFTTADGKAWESQLDGSEMRRFAPEFMAPACCAYWSRNDRLFVFAGSEAGVWNLWAVTQSEWPLLRFESRPTRLTSGPISFRSSTASSDGKQIFAVGETLRGELSVFEPKSQLFTKYGSGLSAGFTDFSRDGQWMVYVTHPEGTLWRSRVDGSERMQLTFPPMGPILNPKWSPDGLSIVFTEYKNWEPNKIYLISAGGGAPLLLLSGDFKPGDPTWSPDGKSIAYGGPSIREGQSTEIRILNLDTKESKTVPGSQGLFSPRWSPDGQYIAAQSADRTQLVLYSFRTRSWSRLPVPNSSSGTYLSWPAWSHDSRYLYYMIGSNIYRAPASGAAAEIAASTANIDIVCPVFALGSWFGLTPDDGLLVLRDRSVQEIYSMNLEYR